MCESMKIRNMHGFDIDIDNKCLFHLYYLYIYAE
jgi:hypothetical protein